MEHLSAAGSPMVIDCGESLDVSVVMDFRALILQAMASSGEIVLDAAHLERIDGAALQLIAALFRDADRKHHAIRWESPSRALTSACKVTGLTEVLHLSAT